MCLQEHASYSYSYYMTGALVLSCLVLVVNELFVMFVHPSCAVFMTTGLGNPMKVNKEIARVI